MEERIPLLRGKVGSEAKGLEKRLHVLSQEWEAGRPLSKDHTPSEVCDPNYDAELVPQSADSSI